MAGDELERAEGGGDGGARRRRRRRRKSRRGAEGRPETAPVERGRDPDGEGGRGRGRGSWRPTESGPTVTLPNTGKLPRRRAALHPARGTASSGLARRRRLTRPESRRSRAT